MTDHITPQEAQELLRGTIPGPWAAIHNMPYISIVLADDEDDIHAPVADITDGTDEPAVHANHELMAAAPDLARTLAADTVEWAVMLTYGREDYIFEDWWYPTEYEAREALSGAKRGTPHLSPRLVARRVSRPWEVTDE